MVHKRAERGRYGNPVLATTTSQFDRIVILFFYFVFPLTSPFSDPHYLDCMHTSDLYGLFRNLMLTRPLSFVFTSLSLLLERRSIDALFPFSRFVSIPIIL